MKVWQEFYCNDCDGYFTAKINMALNNYRIEMMCPNCGHKHPRTIVNGRIMESGYSKAKEEIHVPKSAYSKKPKHKNIKPHARHGEVIKDDNDLVRKSIMRQRWLEIFGG